MLVAADSKQVLIQKKDQRPGCQRGKETRKRLAARLWQIRFYDPITMRRTKSILRDKEHAEKMLATARSR